MLEIEKVIVFVSCLMQLLHVCRTPNCGAYVDKENIKIVRNGGQLSVTSLCNNHHSNTWASSPTFGEGRSAVAVINIILAVNSLRTGLHIKQVLGN